MTVWWIPWVVIGLVVVLIWFVNPILVMRSVGKKDKERQ